MGNVSLAPVLNRSQGEALHARNAVSFDVLLGLLAVQCLRHRELKLLGPDAKVDIPVSYGRSVAIQATNNLGHAGW